MRKLLATVIVAVSLAACGGSNDQANAGGEDSLQRASDSVKQTGDTSALNKPLGDSTSASGIHGSGSGSEVGGGKSGEPQKKDGK